MPFGWVCFSNLQLSKEIGITQKSASQLPFGWVCFSNVHSHDDYAIRVASSQLPFGWVCFSNSARLGAGVPVPNGSQLPFGWVCFSNAASRQYGMEVAGLNCLSAGSVSLTTGIDTGSWSMPRVWSQLPFGWVCFSNVTKPHADIINNHRLNCLSAGSVSLTCNWQRQAGLSWPFVSIAFRLGLFL